MENANGSYLKVGILGKYATREPGQTAIARTLKNPLAVASSKHQPTNPEIGKTHEFGSALRNIPRRSFLRMPILTKLPEEIQKTSTETWQKVLEQFGFEHFLNTIGLLALGVIEDAFRTHGFGTWAKLKASTIRRKGNANILTETAQLRKSITYATVAKGAGRTPL
jgi:hypothetical protein